jgi:hypothetical protein
MTRPALERRSRWRLRPGYQHVSSPQSVCAETEKVPDGAPRASQFVRVRQNCRSLDPRQYTICLPAIRPSSSLIGAVQAGAAQGWRILNPESSLINAQTSFSVAPSQLSRDMAGREVYCGTWPASIAPGWGYVPPLNGPMRLSVGL